MIKTIAIATFAAVMSLGLNMVASAADQAGGQSSSELGSLSPQSGSPSESGKTGIGSTSGSDASIDTGLKSTTQEGKMPCPEQSAASSAERNKGVGIVQGTLGDQGREAKSDSKMDSATPRHSDARSATSDAERNKGVGIVQGTLGDQEREAKSDSKIDATTPRHSDARSSAETSSRMSSDPC